MCVVAATRARNSSLVPALGMIFLLGSLFSGSRLDPWCQEAQGFDQLSFWLGEQVEEPLQLPPPPAPPAFPSAEDSNSFMTSSFSGRPKEAHSCLKGILEAGR